MVPARAERSQEPSGTGSEGRAVQLSCEQCRRRKTRCDKQIPCSACKNSGLTCNAVQRPRLPRGRSAKSKMKGSKLETRISRLEDLVQSLKPPEADIRESNILSSKQVHRGERESSISPVISDFWAALSEKIGELRESLEDSDDDDESAQTVQTQSDPTPTQSDTESTTILFGRQSIENNDLPGTLSPPARRKLFDLYRNRVDCIIKLLHWPTTLSIIERQRAGAFSNLGAAEQALEYSIYFVAVCVMSDAEAERWMSTSKSQLTRLYRIAAETRLSSADFLTKPSVTVLQAFMIYLIGLRICHLYSLTWSLLALAVRSATALQIGSEDPSQYSTFDYQIRRRIWFSLGLLDSWFNLDWGTPALLPSESFLIKPINTNDSYLFTNPDATAPTGTFSDMSFAHVTYQAMACYKDILKDSNDLDTNWQMWTAKLQTITNFNEYLVQQCQSINASSTTFLRFVQSISFGMVFHMELTLRRPPTRLKYLTIPPWDDFDVLERIVQSIEMRKNDESSGEFAAWSWYSWNKWHMVAVLLVELCGEPAGPRSDRAYPVAKEAFQQLVPMITGTDMRIFLGPVTRLMLKVDEIRSGGRRAPFLPLEYGPGYTQDFYASVRGQDMMQMDTGTISNARNEAALMNWDLFLHDISSTIMGATLPQY